MHKVPSRKKIPQATLNLFQAHGNILLGWDEERAGSCLYFIPWQVPGKAWSHRRNLCSFPKLFGRYVEPDSATHELQRARLLCLSLFPRVCWSSCPLHQWCHPTVSSSVVPFSSCLHPSIRVFSDESVLRIRWPKYWSFSISPSSKYSGLISFRIEWFDLLAVQGTLKSLLHHHSLKASILWCSGFFMVQLSHLYTTTGKTVVLTILTFVSNMMSRSLLFRIWEMYLLFVKIKTCI